MQVELISHMGTDLTVVDAARVSFNKKSSFSDEGGLSVRDTKLVGYLASHNHITPFTHPQITLRETVPIFVARQRFKHVVGFTYNEISRRYVDDEPSLYVPALWRKRAENKKQGSLEEGIELQDNAKYLYEVFCRDALNLYNELLQDGVAPEQARMVLPQSMMTSYYVTGSLAAFARAYGLRSTPDAQAEIRVLADQWDKLIAPLFPVSWAALVNSGRTFDVE